MNRAELPGIASEFREQFIYIATDSFQSENSSCSLITQEAQFHLRFLIAHAMVCISSMPTN